MICHQGRRERGHGVCQQFQLATTGGHPEQASTRRAHDDLVVGSPGRSRCALWQRDDGGCDPGDHRNPSDDVRVARGVDKPYRRAVRREEWAGTVVGAREALGGEAIEPSRVEGRAVVTEPTVDQQRAVGRHGDQREELVREKGRIPI